MTTTPIHRFVCRLVPCLFAVTVFAGSTSPTPFAIHDGDRVVFYGDSITDSQWHPSLVETYVLTRYPTWRNSFSNRGVSGDNSGSIARFERDVLKQKADVCTYNMGFNDGGYGLLEELRLKRWLENITQSAAMAKDALPDLHLVLVSPIPNEVTVSDSPRWVSHQPYPYVMLSFGAEEGRLAEQLGLSFIDLGLRYGQSMGLGQVAAGPAFSLSRDGVHPQREGQSLIAFHLLQGLGASATVATVDIDAAAGSVMQVHRCTISDLDVTDGIVRFRRQSESLPYPTPPEARPFAFLVRLDDNLNRDLLTIKGLSAQAYSLFIDDQPIADISAEELAEGLNLSRFVQTPMYRQALKVMDAVHEKQLAEIALWRTYICTGKADGAGNPTEEATPEERASLAVAKQQIATLVNSAYTINHPQPHAFRLEPTTVAVSRYDALLGAEINQPPLVIKMSPLATDWNRMSLHDGAIQVSVHNPAAVSRSGTLSWAVPAGWDVQPRETTLSLAAGARTNIAFTAGCEGRGALVPTPQLTVAWRWAQDWPYPMALTRPVELLPELEINRAATVPGLVGNPEDWRDATAFVLDKAAMIDPAVAGKRRVWGGPDDLSGTFFLKWDDDALYIAAMVRDNEHVQQASPQMRWSEDCLMLAFHLKEAGLPDRRLEYVFASTVDGDLIQVTSGDAASGAGPEIRFKTHLDADAGRCFYEIALPWERLAPLPPAIGKDFRFTLAVSDADSQPGRGFNYLEWTPGINYGKNPSDFARIRLGALAYP